MNFQTLKSEIALPTSTLLTKQTTLVFKVGSQVRCCPWLVNTVICRMRNLLVNLVHAEVPEVSRSSCLEAEFPLGYRIKFSAGLIEVVFKTE